MNKRISQLLLTMSLVFSGVAMAAPPSVTIGNGAGQVGSAVPVVIDMNFNTDSTVALIQYDVTYDSTQLSVSSFTCDSILISASPLELINITCSEVTPGTIRVLANNTLLNPIADTLLGQINFDVSGAEAAVYPLAVSGEVYGNSASQPVPSGGSTDGSVTVSLGPQPDWSSVPTSADGMDFGSHTTETGTYPMDLVVTNAGEAGSTLTGSCDITSGGDTVFSISGDNTLGAGLAPGASAPITVVCDTTGAPVAVYLGTMSCTHNGDGTTEESVTDYSLGCNVTATPEPSFMGVDNGLSAMDVPEQGDPDATATLTVSNNGDSGTTLIGSCVYAGDTEITVTNNTFAIAQGDPGVDVLATCSGAAEGTYTGNLTCGPTDPQTWVAADSPYTVSCTVGPPGDAVYSSDPAPGSVFNLTPPGEPVPVGATIPTQDLVITNDPPETNDRELALLNCDLGGNVAPTNATPLDLGPISATAAVTPLAPGVSTTVTFSCDSSFAGVYEETYSCSYDVDGDGEVDGTASYPVKCEIREAESEVTQTPESGSVVTIFAPLGGFGQGSVLFNEILDENETGSVDDCYLDDDTYFGIISPNSFPQTVDSGGSVEILFEGMGTADGQSTSTTLYCTYSDSQNESTEVSWDLEVTVLAAGIPTLSTWGLMLMILTLLGLGGVMIRRKDLS